MKITTFPAYINAVSTLRNRRPSLVGIRVAAALFATSGISAFAADYFDPSLLQLGGGQQDIDLSQFENTGGQAEGTYNVDVYVSGQFQGTRNIRFVHDQKKNLQPQLTPAMLDEWGVNLGSDRTLATLSKTDVLPEALDTYIPHSTVRLDLNQLRLNVNIPQLNMKPNHDTLADPSLWQEGDTAFLLNYSLSGNNYHSDNNGYNSDSRGMFGMFNSGLNFGPWRLRNRASYSYNELRFDRYDSLNDTRGRDSRSQEKWTSQQTYLQRDIAFLRSQLTMGETSTGSVASQVLDGFSFRGVGLMSSDSMMPGNMNGFSPVINGIASSNALVTVKQNGYVIYEANVAPGPFRFTDLSGSGTAGDLEVTIKEADGSVHGFRQPYSSLPVMQREGRLRYETAVGEYYTGHNGYSGIRTPGFAMLTGIYGLPGDVTVYGGGIASNDYQSLALGTGFSLGHYGALSLDVTQSRATLSDTGETMAGQSYRMRYSKSMLTTGTTVDMTAYRYSTKNFLTFNEANTSGYDTSNGLPDWLNGRRKSSYELRLSQRLWSQYQLWVSGHRDNYWGSDKTNTTLSAGLSGSMKSVGWSLGYSVDRIRGDGNWPENRQLTLNLNVPMSIFGSSAAFQNSYANYSLMHDNDGRTTNQLSLAGGFGENRNLSWGVSQSQRNQGEGNSGSASLGYSGSYGSANVGYNYDSSGGRGITYSANGGLVAHRHGVTLARNISDAAVVVHTGVPGVKVMNGDTTTDMWGNAVVTGVRTYGRNNISLDPSSLPEGANPPGGGHGFYPTAGAVVVDENPVRLGQQILMNLFFRGKPVPFGAVASLSGEKDTSQGSIVGEGGQVYLAGLPQKGTIDVKWGTAADKQCKADFVLPEPASRSKDDDSWHPLATQDVNCR
ncbi:fimbrial biogenesis outer membrane usher protein [Enterobacter asburiae]|nr:fimbrial biogenesis outer membrane usher protein [Enterobacter asburiae]